MTNQQYESLAEVRQFVADIDKLRATSSWTEIGDYLGEDSEKVRSRYRRYLKILKKEEGEPEIEKAAKQAGRPSETNYAEIIFSDKKHAEEIDWREYVEHATAAEKLAKRASDINRIATVRIKSDKPIVVVYTGDWHLGDIATDHQSWMNDMNYILENPFVYVVDLGDDRQNMTSFSVLSAVLGQSLTPAQQGLLIKSIVDELTDKNKLLAKVDGNHDVEFDERVLGQAVQKYLLAKLKAPRFSNKGIMKLYVGDQLYTNLLFHKSRFRSFLRTTHGNLREHQLLFPAEVVAGAHDHSPGFEILNRYEMAREAGFDFGGETYLIKCGTYQDSPYGWKYFHGGGQGNPTVVYYPDRHKKLFFMDMRDAIEWVSRYYQ